MSIHPATHVHSIHLTVPNLDRSVRFYVEHLGLQSHRRDGAVAALGTGQSDLLVVHESPAATRAHGTTGLYHFALLVPSRPDLARAFRRLAERRTPMQGFADHLVSEAIYLSDPDGNGIEIYRDRPREEWPLVNGQIQMATNPLDLAGLLKDADADADAAHPAPAAAASGAAPRGGLPAGTRMGHVHLHVSRLEDTARFYVGILGFDLIARYGDSALFMSAGGYHHHVGANTWAGVGAPTPPSGAIGLKHVVIGLPDQAAIDDVAARVSAAGLAAVRDAGHLEVVDPSGNALRFIVAPARQSVQGHD